MYVYVCISDRYHYYYYYFLIIHCNGNTIFYGDVQARWYITNFYFNIIRIHQYQIHTPPPLRGKLFPSISISVSFCGARRAESLLVAEARRNVWKIWMAELLELINLEQFHGKGTSSHSPSFLHFFFSSLFCLYRVSTLLSVTLHCFKYGFVVGRSCIFQFSQIVYLLTQSWVIDLCILRIFVIMLSWGT